MLTLSNVSVNYGAIEALTDISLKIEQGEVVTLIGANGAGKTTTLRTITGLLQPRSGTVTFEGEDISGKPAHKLVARGISMSPEGRGVFANLSVRENLQMGAYLMRNKKAIADDMERAFRMFPRLKEREAQKAGTLSGGEQQMLAMGRALMSNPRLLLLDEPSLGLAPLVVHTIFEAIDEIKSKGTTILLVEQNAHAALGHSDRAYVLETGRIVMEGPSKDLVPTLELEKRILVSRPRNTAVLLKKLTRKKATGLPIKKVIPVLLSILLCVSLACSPTQQSAGANTTIKIGYFGDLTGPTFNFGQSAYNGVLMAADQINQAGGINGKKLDVVIYDDKGSPEEAARLTGKLIEQDKVVAIIAGGTSGNSRAAAPKAQSAGVPLISPSSTDPAVTKVGDFVFRACFVDSFQGEVMARFAVNTLKAQKAAILFDFNSAYGRGLTDYFELAFAKLGGKIVIKQSYMQGDSDFKGQLSSIKATQPDVIYIPGYYGDVAIIAKQARRLGITQPLLGGDGWDAPELWQLGGDALNGAYISTHYSVDDPSPAIQEFVHDYRQRYGNLLPDAHAALAYDAMRLLVDAITRAGSTESRKLREALSQTKNFSGVTGIISMDAERNAVKSAAVLKLMDAKSIYQETIQPELQEPQRR